jgi:ubiquinone/menaquinone biosynthesis C-methylase UbiE
MNFDLRLPQTDAVLAALRAYRSKRVLNVSCGKGVMTEKVAEICSTIAYVTPSDRIENIRRHYSRALEIVQAHPCSLPFPQASFDAVLCTQLIDHLASPDARRLALEEMARVIRPDGRLIITVLHQNFRFDGFGIAKEGAPEGTFYHRYYLDEFREQLAHCWRIESMCGVWSYLPKSYQIYTRLGRFVVYWERVLRQLPISLRYGKVLLAVCSPTSTT